jgi:type IV pilus assembly protein PilN
MIEINLLPGAAKKAKRGGPGMSLGSVASAVRTRIKDPSMLAAVVSVVLAGAAVGGLSVTQSRTSADLTAREEKAVRDSARFATVLRERRSAEAKRDSVLRQLQVIRAIDDDRFVWAHIMDEVSRALPPYTWLKSLAVTSATPAVAAVTPPPATAPKKDDAKDAKDAPKQSKDPVPSNEALKFRIVGNTVDIQALTRFMRLLETSPFIQNVQLARSDLAMVDGKEVTEFQLDAQYERPDKSAITTAPVSLSVR